MAIVYQHDKRAGKTYAYESKSFRDKETGKVRAKRTLIGRVDPETGEIVPTDGRNRKPKAEKVVDYEALYVKALKKIESQEMVIKNLKNENAKLKLRVK